MLKVGLTGGIASGKSFVGEALAGYGCLLIQADELGHAVLAPGGEAYQPVLREFGREILNGDGTIDRRALAVRAFGDPERLARLNALVHPAVIQRENQSIAAYGAAPPPAPRARGALSVLLPPLPPPPPNPREKTQSIAAYGAAHPDGIAVVEAA